MPAETCLDCGHIHGPAHADCRYRPPAWLSDTRVTGDYDIRRLLGRGGMGETFLARHKRLNAERVLKSILPAKSTPDYIQRFDQEARVASTVRDPHVATLHDYFVCEDGSPVAVWEYIDGQSAAMELIHRGAFAPREAVRLAMQMLSGLSAIHAQQLTHRDIKPGNLMIDRTRGDAAIKIIDFGLAKSYGDNSNSSHAVGTYPYMPPEAWDPDDIDHAAPTVDIFAAGAVCYEFLVGARAFPGNQAQVAARFAAATEPSWVGPLSPGVPLAKWLIPILRRTLAIKPAERYQSAEELRDDLRYALGQFDAANDGAVPDPRAVTVPYPQPVNAPAAPALKTISTPDETTDFFLRAHLEHLIEDSAWKIEPSYVPLAATTRAPIDTDARHDPALLDAASSDPTDDNPVDASHEIRIEDVADALNIHRQFYVVGEPGAGKTVSLMAMELSAARRYLAGTYRRFPLRVDVSSWIDDEKFDAFVERELESRTRIRSLPPSRLLLLVDGVIDSAAASRDPMTEIESWLHRYGGCAAALAVRTERSFGRKLPTVILERLDDTRIRTVIAKQIAAEPKGAALLDQIGLDRTGDRDRGISTLVRNPFNLTLVCRLQSKDRLPGTQAALMRKVLSARLEQECRGRPGRPRWAEFVDALGGAAIRIISTRASLGTDKAGWRKLIAAPNDVEQILSLALDCDVVIGRPVERYEFKHRLYLEYLAAEYLRSHRAHLDTMLHEPRYENGERVARRFDEVIQALVQLEFDFETIRIIAAHDPFLAATCLPSIIGDEDQRGMAESAVVSGLTTLMSDSQAREKAIVTLAKIGAAAIPGLRRLLTDARSFVRRGAVRALAQIPDLEAICAVLGALDDSNRWVRDDARGAIRRFDAVSRNLFLRCIRRDLDRSTDEEREARVTTLADLIEDVRPDFATEIARIVEIDVANTAVAETTAIEAPDPILIEEENWPASEEEPPSWGFRWLQERRAAPHDPELQLSGHAWLRATSVFDRAWPFVWTELWSKSPGDPDLEWLGRDSLNRMPATARPWSHLWRNLYRVHPTDQMLVDRGRQWLSEVPSSQPGWTYVWLALWESKRYREELLRLAWWWLEAGEANAGWSIVWQALWNGDADRETLIAVGGKWLAQADPANPSWGFVWPQLWEVSPGNEMLHRIALEWLDRAPADHTAWGYLWPALWKVASDPELEKMGRRWLKEAPDSHAGWGYVWVPLWDAKDGDVELAEVGRSFLSTTQPTHRGWSPVWLRLWERSGDEQLAFMAREWLNNAPAHAGWVYVATSLLERFPGDETLLSAGLAALSRVPDEAWGSLWMRLWDFGGDRDKLGVIGRAWLFGQDIPRGSSRLRNGGFSFVWERLYAVSGKDRGLHDLGIRWLRVNSDDKKWQFVAQSLSDANQHDAELLEIARTLVETRRRNWTAALRILSRAGERLKTSVDLSPERSTDRDAYRKKAIEMRRRVTPFLERNDLHEAEQRLTALVAAAAEGGDALEQGTALNELGGVLRRLGQHEAARDTLMQALEIFTRRRPIAAAKGYTLHKLGDLCADQRNWIEAEEAYRGAMLLRWALNDHIAYAISLDSLAKMHRDAGFIAASRQEALEAMEIFTRIGTKEQRARGRVLLDELGKLDGD